MGEHEEDAGRVGAAASHQPGAVPDDASVVRHEERLALGRTSRELGVLRARKRVVGERVDEVFQRSVEAFDEVERASAPDGDSGEVEVLPDGSISIPILEEELVVTKRTVVRERLIVRKRTETKHERVETELRREEIEFETEGEVRPLREPG